MFKRSTPRVQTKLWTKMPTIATCWKKQSDDNCNDCKINKYLIEQLGSSIEAIFKKRNVGSPEEIVPFYNKLHRDYMKLPDDMKVKAKTEIWPDWLDVFESIEQHGQIEILEAE
jgi:hypothetical protein